MTDPLTKQRSKWIESDDDLPKGVRTLLGPDVRVLRRNVHDGVLRVLISEEPGGWHLLISHGYPKREGGRYPTWDEISHARYQLLPLDLDFVMHLPPPDEYVAVHDTTFHLWESPERP